MGKVRGGVRLGGEGGLDEEYDHWAENLDEIIMAVEA
jgi:hypothetical protein